MEYAGNPNPLGTVRFTKKDGGIRFVVDYRTLNSMTKKDAYPLPNPRDRQIDKLSGDQVFSKLDCCSAYWAVALEEKDIPRQLSLHLVDIPKWKGWHLGYAIAKQPTSG